MWARCSPPKQASQALATSRWINHSVRRAGVERCRRYQECREFFISPARSYRQLENKIVNGGRAYVETELPVTIGDNWRHLYAVRQAAGCVKTTWFHPLTLEEKGSRLAKRGPDSRRNSRERAETLA